MPSGYPVPKLNRDELRKLINLGFSREQLANNYSVAWSTVRSWMRELNLSFPDNAKLTTNEMIRLYFDDGLTLEEDPRPDQS